MKASDIPTVAADPLISKVRRAKTAVAQKYGFNVIAMVQALRQIDEEENATKELDSTTTSATDSSEFP
jgi:hypothetical protein